MLFCQLLSEITCTVVAHKNSLLDRFGDGRKKHLILGGEVRLYRRKNSKLWQCSTFLKGQSFRVSTKEESLTLAKEFAEDWYFTLRGSKISGKLKGEKTFRFASAQFLKEFEADTMGQRNPKCLSNHKIISEFIYCHFSAVLDCRKSKRLKPKITGSLERSLDIEESPLLTPRFKKRS